MPRTGYHKEIDGLRAIAVLVIIFFHMKIPGFHGGFIGVDVFFVVSGFLITQIIVSSLETGQFSFRDFYIRRVTRIIPALAKGFSVELKICARKPDKMVPCVFRRGLLYRCLPMTNR